MLKHLQRIGEFEGFIAALIYTLALQKLIDEGYANFTDLGPWRMGALVLATLLVVKFISNDTIFRARIKEFTDSCAKPHGENFTSTDLKRRWNFAVMVSRVLFLGLLYLLVLQLATEMIPVDERIERQGVVERVDERREVEVEGSSVRYTSHLDVTRAESEGGEGEMRAKGVLARFSSAPSRRWLLTIWAMVVVFAYVIPNLAFLRVCYTWTKETVRWRDCTPLKTLRRAKGRAEDSLVATSERWLVLNWVNVALIGMALITAIFVEMSVATWIAVVVGAFAVINVIVDFVWNAYFFFRTEPMSVDGGSA